MTVGYTYLTTNLIDNMKYIGLHTSPEFDPKYIGSGTYFGNALKKHGKENFKCEVLNWYDTYEELVIAEVDEINERNAVESEEYYNLTNTPQPIYYAGYEFFDELNKARMAYIGGLPKTEEWKKNMSDSRKAWFETPEGQQWKEVLREKFTENNPSYKGMEPNLKFHLQETKDLISEKNKEYYKTHESIHKGIPKTEEQKRKISETKTGTKLTQEHKNNIAKGRTGTSQPESQKIKVAEKLSKTYKITDPNGFVEIITNMNKHCKLHGLSVGMMTSLATGKVKYYKGYKVELIVT